MMSGWNPYSHYISIKNKLYDQQRLRSLRLKPPVISVGNLSVGGTGKTPFILFLLDLFNKQKMFKKVLIVSKSYKAKLRMPAEVNLKIDHPAAFYGDEPCLLKIKSEEFDQIQVDIWAGPVKSETADFAVNYSSQHSTPYDCVIIDDGFSHRQLQRQLDIVLLDCSQKLDHYKLLPVGRLREPLEALERSQIVVLTKVKQAQSHTLDYLTSQLKIMNIEPIWADYESIVDLKDTSAFVKSNGFLLFCGIGNPDNLKKQLTAYPIKKEYIFSDHYNYTAADELELLSVCRNENLRPLTTAKDFVKLQNDELKKQIEIIDLNILMNDLDQGRIYEKIRTIL